MPTKLVFFDLEETLAHIQVDDTPVFNYLRSELQGLNLPGEVQQGKSIREVLGRVEKAADKPVIERVEESLNAKLGEVEKASAASSRERKDAKRALLSVQSRGTSIGIVTKLSEQGAKEVLGHLNIEGTFEIEGSAYHSKDQKEGIVNALRRLGLKPDDAAFVTISVEGVEAARASGVRSIAVFSQESSFRQVLASHPDAFIYSIAELENTLAYFDEKARLSEPKPAVQP